MPRARGENRLGAGNVRPRPFSVHVFVTCQTKNSELSLVQLRPIEAHRNYRDAEGWWSHVARTRDHATYPPYKAAFTGEVLLGHPVLT